MITLVEFYEAPGVTWFFDACQSLPGASCEATLNEGQIEGRSSFWTQQTLKNITRNTLPETNIALKIGLPNRKVVFQPSIFRCYVNFREGIPVSEIYKLLLETKFMSSWRISWEPWGWGISGDSWMYPYQRTPMGNPYISPIYPYIVGVYGLLSARIPI